MDYDTMGDVLGDDMLGDEDFQTVGRLALPMKRGAMLRLPAKPAWRRQLAPGVPMPGQGLQPLPLTPSANNGVLTSAVTLINFDAAPQRPFRAERLLVSVARTGAAAVRALCTGIFVGSVLQQAELGNFDIEFFGPTAFGVRLTFATATPGVRIRFPVIPSAAIAVGDAVTIQMLLLGRTVG